MTCPFKVGDRIHEVTFAGITTSLGPSAERPFIDSYMWELDTTKPDATVTALTARGFTYRYDRPIQFGRPDWGTTQSGEIYEEGFMFWRKVSSLT